MQFSLDSVILHKYTNVMPKNHFVGRGQRLTTVNNKYDAFVAKKAYFVVQINASQQFFSAHMCG